MIGRVLQEAGSYNSELMYYKKPDEIRFSSKVLYSYVLFGKTYLILDKTFFFPKSSNQDSDKGTINKVPVLKVEKLKNAIIHVLNGVLRVKEKEAVNCIIDKKRRSMLSKTHSAQHIITSLLLKKGFEQKSVWITPGMASLLIAGQVSKDDLLSIEVEVNKLFKKPQPVRILEMNFNEAKQKIKSLRFHKDFYGKVRIIKIGNVDACTCGGTHIKNTKEIKKINLSLKKQGANSKINMIVY